MMAKRARGLALGYATFAAVSGALTLGPIVVIAFGAAAIGLGAHAALYHRAQARRAVTVAGVSIWVTLTTVVAAVATFTAVVAPSHSVSTGSWGIPAVPNPNAVASSSLYTVTISWSGVATATSYDVQYQTSGGGFGSLVSNLNAITYDHTSLAGGTTYGYQVRACNLNGCSSWSSTTSALTIPAVPAAPAATPSSSTAISVTWSAVTGATTYDLQNNVSGGSYGDLQMNNAALFKTHSGLSANTTYGYQVRACDATGCSAYSSPTTATTPPTATTLSGSIAGTTASLSWNVPTGAVSQALTINSNGGTLADTFDRTNSGSIGTTSDSSQTWTAVSGTFGITSNQAYLSSTGSTTIATLGGGTPDGFVQFTYGANDSTYYGVVFRYEDSNNYWRFVYTNNGTSGTGRVYKTLAGSSSLATSWNESINGAGLVFRVEYSGANVVVKQNGSQKASTTDASLSGATGVGLYADNTTTGSARWDSFSSGRYATEATPVDVTGQTSYSSSTLSLNQTYSYTISSCNALNSCSSSNMISGYTDDTAPLLSTSVASSTQVNLSWTRSGLYSQTAYQWQWRAAGGSWSASTTTTSLSASKTSLSAGTAYEFRVRSCFQYAFGFCLDPPSGNSSPWTTALATTSATAVASAPTSVNTVLGTTAVEVSWTAPATGKVTDYRVHAYGVGGEIAGSPKLVGSAEPSYIYTGLTNGTAYNFAVDAVNSAGNSSSSSLSQWTIPATTLAERLAPDAILSSSNLSSPTVGPIQDDPDNYASDVTSLNGTSDTTVTSVRVSFPTPAAPITGNQEFKVYVKKRNHSGFSTNAIVVLRLYENGSLISSTSNNTVTSTASSGLLSYTWSATGRTASDIELVIDQTGNANVTMDVYAAEWNTVETTPSFSAPNAPTSVTASAGSGEASLTWNAPSALSLDIPIVDYRVTVYSSSGGAPVGVVYGSTLTRALGASTLSYTFNGLRPGIVYGFKVEAYNAFGWGTISSLSNTVTISS